MDPILTCDVDVVHVIVIVEGDFSFYVKIL